MNEPVSFWRWSLMISYVTLLVFPFNHFGWVALRWMTDLIFMPFIQSENVSRTRIAAFFHLFIFFFFYQGHAACQLGRLAEWASELGGSQGCQPSKATRKKAVSHHYKKKKPNTCLVKGDQNARQLQLGHRYLHCSQCLWIQTVAAQFCQEKLLSAQSGHQTLPPLQSWACTDYIC